MTRKSVETLLVLVENAGRVIPKDELLSTIWPDRVVDEANLTQNIAMVRRALGAERGTPAYIETFPGRGYRLLGPVTLEETAPEPAPTVKTLSVPAPTASAPESATEAVTETVSLAALPADGSGTLSNASGWLPPDSPSAAPPPARSRPRRARVWLTAVLALVATVSGGSWWLWRQPTTEAVAEFRITPFTRLAGKEWQPALTPDGQRAAFLWEPEDGQQPPEIRIQTDSPSGASTTLRIARAGSHYASPAWSPDGQALAYLRIEKAATEVLLTSLANTTELGPERLVTRFTPANYGLQYRLLDWSPDGQWLVVSHSSAPHQPNGLFLVKVATGEQKALTKPDALVGGDLDPHFSPDGQFVSFIRHIQRSHQELYLIPVAGGEARPLTAAGKRISSHDWFGQGHEIVFAADRSGEFRLWRLPLNPAAAAQEIREPQRIEIFDSFPIELSVARQAGRLLYAVQQQDRNIWRLDLKDKSWTRLLASSAQDASPQFSPQGDQICFRSDRTGEEQLWVSAANGNNLVQVTRGALFPSVGHWSPDGRRIVFHNSQTGEIHLAQPTSAGAWQVQPLGVNGVHPIFSADGQWIYVGTTKQIFKVPVTGGTPSELVNTGGFSLGLSSDGLRLFFMREVNDTVLWQVRTDTGELTRAVEGLLPACTSCWALTPDGLYYLGSDKSSFDAQAIYFHRFAARPDEADRLIIRYPEPLAPVGSGPFSLSPDLRTLLCVRLNPSNSDLMRVEPFR